MHLSACYRRCCASAAAGSRGEQAASKEAVEEEEVAEPEPEAAAPAPAEEKKAGRVYDESYAESKADMAKVAEEAERLADANDQGKRDM